MHAEFCLRRVLYTQRMNIKTNKEQYVLKSVFQQFVQGH
jgi:hypothetical protein